MTKAANQIDTSLICQYLNDVCSELIETLHNADIDDDTVNDILSESDSIKQRMYQLEITEYTYNQTLQIEISSNNNLNIHRK